MKSKNVHGFTLVECSVVVMLIVFCILLSLGNLSFIQRLVGQAELDLLHSVCRYTQHKAQATHKEQAITFNVHKNSYTDDDVHIHILPHYLQFGTIPGVKGPPASPSRPISSPITFVHNKLVCYPTGIISSGTLYLTDRNHQILYALSNAVGSVSYPRKYRYANTKWHVITS